MAVATSRPRASARQRRPGGDWRRAVRKYGPAYLFLAPNFLGVLVFIAFPVFFALYMSFQDWNGVTPPRFIALGNFRDIFTDPLFWLTLKNTAIYTVLTVPTGVVFSLGVAALLHQRVRGLSLFRTAMFIPVVTSALAAAVIWKWIFDYNNGLINDILSLLNLNQIPWLSDPTWFFIGLAIFGVWQSFGLSAIILLAALQGVPESLLEAASIDGAGAWRRFRSITLPLITPAMLFVTITSFITAFQVFAQVYYLTSGSPGVNTATYVMNVLIYRRAFEENRLGSASALAYILFAIIFVVTVVQLRLSRGVTNAASEFEV